MDPFPAATVGVSGCLWGLHQGGWLEDKVTPSAFAAWKWGVGARAAPAHCRPRACGLGVSPELFRVMVRPGLLGAPRSPSPLEGSQPPDRPREAQ